MQAEHICKNCGNQFTGNFCNVCGEKVYTEHDKTFGHFMEEGFHFITHFDSKLLKTWWLMMTRPGFVSKEISEGRRKPYYKPMNLFIIGVILYLLFPFFEGLNFPMKYHRAEMYGEIAEHMIEKKMEKKHLTLDQLAEKFDHKSPKFAKLLLLLIVPLTGLVFHLLFLKRNRFYFDHITLAAEVNTFYLFFTFFLMPIAFIIVFLVASYGFHVKNLRLGDDISMPLYMTVLGIYSVVAFRRFYGEKKVWAIIKCVLFLFAHWLIVYTIYRFILFCLVMMFI